jgi:hypothetical protein
MLSASKVPKRRVGKRLNYLFRRSLQEVNHRLEDYARSLTYDSNSKPIVNQREIRVIGLRRSGNHTVINWIGKQTTGNSIFINHVKPLENPYRNQYENQLNLQRAIERGADWKYRDLAWWEQERKGNFSDKFCLMYSYEDQDIEKVAHPAFERMREIYLGKSQHQFDVIVMRDPYNLFASRLQTKPRDEGPNFDMLNVYSKRYSLPDLWVAYAKEALGETSFLCENKIFINYNRWFLEETYRRQVATELGLEFSDEGLNDISKAGRGSSFDGDRFAGEAYRMDVLNRWRSYTENPTYLRLLKAEGVIEYSRKIFGDIPGTDALVG